MSGNYSANQSVVKESSVARNSFSNAMNSIPFSILDLVPVAAGSTINQSLRNARDLAQHA